MNILPPLLKHLELGQGPGLGHMCRPGAWAGIIAIVQARLIWLGHCVSLSCRKYWKITGQPRDIPTSIPQDENFPYFKINIFPVSDTVAPPPPISYNLLSRFPIPILPHFRYPFHSNSESILFLPYFRFNCYHTSVLVWLLCIPSRSALCKRVCIACHLRIIMHLCQCQHKFQLERTFQ